MTAWTPEEVDQVAQLMRDGLSVSQIAVRTGKTRSTIISKIHRDKSLKAIGLARGARVALPGDFTRKPIAISATRSNKTVPGGKPAKIAGQNLHATNIQNKKISRQADPVFVEKVVSVAIEPHMIALADLKEADCKWPIGDPRHASFGFCGHVSAPESPYCRAHHKLAYQPRAAA